MKRPLLFKTLAIGLLILLLLIPIAMISSSIDERKYYSQSVVEDIARSSSYSQTITGPVLVVPYSKIVTCFCWCQSCCCLDPGVISGCCLVRQ